MLHRPISIYQKTIQNPHIDFTNFSYFKRTDNTPNCQPDEFACPNDRCIPQQRVCDDYEDCLGGEDEHNCATERPHETTPRPFVSSVVQGYRKLCLVNGVFTELPYRNVLNINARMKTDAILIRIVVTDGMIAAMDLMSKDAVSSFLFYLENEKIFL